jgi:hypothetical protein
MTWRKAAHRVLPDAINAPNSKAVNDKQVNQKWAGYD